MRKLLFISFIYFPALLQGQSSELTYLKSKDSDLNIILIETQIDSIITNGIDNEAFPGAQLLVAKDNKIIFHKAYGYHTYDNIKKVGLTDSYDLASVTKIAGPLLPIMKLYDQGKLDLDKSFSTYWHSWKNRKDKKDITLRELLAHQAGMEPYIVFLNDVLKKGKFKKRFLKNKLNTRFLNQAYRGIYVKNRFKNKVFRKIKRSKVSNEKTYRYSGLASLIYPSLIENITEKSYVDYLQHNFYDPLGSTTLGYHRSLKLIRNTVPTEIDSLFRKELVKGYVHDENAALLGGISGNAGLFGSALDLAKLMQMLVQKGEYNGKRYFKESTVNEFIKVQYPENNNRRGLGFDKPLLGNSNLDITKAYPAPQVSAESFGHSGFTGTFVWADPEHQLIFIFLSNRVYPSRTHRNIYNLNIRPSLQQVFYKALKLKE